MTRLARAALTLGLIGFAAATPARADKTAVTDDGVKNIGSSLAYVALCEKAGHIEVGLSREMIDAMREAFTRPRYQDLMDQYQESVHDKRQYSPSQSRWIPFRINQANCHDLEKAVPVLLSYF